MSKLNVFNGINGVKIYIDFEKDITAVHLPESISKDGEKILERFIYNGKVDIIGSDLKKMQDKFLSNYSEIVE